MSKTTSRRSSRTSCKYKRARKDYSDSYYEFQDIRKPASERFKLLLLEEVKKYPILYDPQDDGEEDTESCYDAWEKIFESIDKRCMVIKTVRHAPVAAASSLTLMEIIDYYRKTWNDIKKNNSRYMTGETSGMYAETNKSAGENNESNNSLDENNESNNSSEPYPAGTEFELALIEEVKKYPVISKSLYEDIYSKRCYKAWEKIAQALQIKAVNPRIRTNLQYCRDKWLFIIDSFIRYCSGDPYKANVAAMQAMQILYPECNDRADENNELNNSSEVGSAPAESSEEISPPTTNDEAVPAPQPAATPGNPQSIGSRPTERAVSFAIVDHLFDSLRSPAARTDVCNLLIQLVHKYQPNVSSDIIEYGARQPDLFNIDWSGLSIPEDLCREIWRRDAEEKLRKVHKISPSKRRAKKEN